MFGKKQKISEETTVEPIREPEPPAEPAPNVFVPSQVTMIGKGVTFYGNFETSDPIQVSGAIEGDIASKSSLEIAESGAYHGKAAVQSMFVEGVVNGDIVCADLSKFTSTAKMEGTLATSRLVTEDGSAFGGSLKLIKQQAKSAKAPAAPVQAEIKTEAKAETGDVPADEEFIFK